MIKDVTLHHDFSFLLDRFEFIFEMLPGEFWVSGGSVVESLQASLDTDLNDKIHCAKDYDLYFPDSLDLEYTKQKLCSKGGKIIYETRYAVGIVHEQSDKIFELIKIYYPTPEEVIESFDLVHCKTIVTRDKILADDRVMTAISNKYMILTPAFYREISEERIGKTLHRIRKYSLAGFNLDSESLWYLLDKIITYFDLSKYETDQYIISQNTDAKELSEALHDLDH